MPIKSEVNGDLISLAKQGRYRAIVHGANCFCVMGAGLAPQIAKEWPEAEMIDSYTTTGDKSKLGRYSSYRSDEVTVINAYTQYGTGGRAKGLPDIEYKAVAKVFTSINSVYGGVSGKIGIPQIGAGLAGGHWEAIKTIIDLVTPDLDIELVIYNPME